MTAHAIENITPEQWSILKPKCKYKSFINSIVKPIFEEINNLDNNTLKKLDFLITGYLEKNKGFLIFGIEDLILGLYTEASILRNDKKINIEHETIGKLHTLLNKKKKLIELMKLAEKENPENLQKTINSLSQSGEFKKETSVIVHGLATAIFLTPEICKQSPPSEEFLR